MLGLLMLSYWKEVLSTAFWSSLDWVGQSPATIVFAVLMAAIGFASSGGLEKGKTELRRQIGKGLRLLVPAVLAWLCFFLWAVATTPYKLHAKQKQDAENKIKELQAEIDALRKEVRKSDVEPLPCFHPLSFKDEQVEPKTTQFPYRRRITITSPVQIAKPTFWVYATGEASWDDSEPPHTFPCNSGSFGGKVLEYNNCQQPIGPDKPYVIWLRSDLFFAIVCIENKTTQ